MQELMLDTTQTKSSCLLRKYKQSKTKAPTPQLLFTKRCFQLISIHNPLNKGQITLFKFSMVTATDLFLYVISRRVSTTENYGLKLLVKICGCSLLFPKKNSIRILLLPSALKIKKIKSG